jgi:hypothetical protein
VIEGITYVTGLTFELEPVPLAVDSAVNDHHNSVDPRRARGRPRRGTGD